LTSRSVKTCEYLMYLSAFATKSEWQKYRCGAAMNYAVLAYIYAGIYR